MSRTRLQNSLDSHRQLFVQKAEAVSATVKTVRYLEQAMDHCIGLCLSKDPKSVSTDAHRRPPDGTKRIAAPAIGPRATEIFAAICREKKIDLLRSHIRDHLRDQADRLDVGFTVADYGIAETGTLVLDSTEEDIRLATMFCDIHVAVLPASKIARRTADVELEIADMLKPSGGYVAFITGASRTADIERVLAIGVHGPRELHILIMEES
jgi:L-lactate dehydrogenase complex protein LldG